MPAAILANFIDSERLKPPANPAAILAITVSPAPETSNTSFASVGKSCLLTFPFILSSKVIPSEPLVIKSEFKCKDLMSSFPFLVTSASSLVFPTTLSNSWKFGVMIFADLYLEKSSPFGSTKIIFLNFFASFIRLGMSLKVPLS